jgi:hypothetical protein
MLFEPLDLRKMGEFDYLLPWIVLLSDPGILSALDAASHELAKACW